MRLIDADYFKENGFVHDLDCCGDYVFYDTIEDAPTVDAIPIEWIRKQIQEHTEFETWELIEYGEAHRYSVAWENLIERWQDGKID